MKKLCLPLAVCLIQLLVVPSLCLGKETPLKTRQFLTEPVVMDKKYGIMTGPKTRLRFKLFESDDSELLWLKGIRVTPVDEDGKTPMSSEFVCHSYVRLAKNEPDIKDDHMLQHMPDIFKHTDLLAVYHGQLMHQLPEGFGIPIRSAEDLFFSLTALNLNIENRPVQVRFKVEIYFYRDLELDKPIRALNLKAIELKDPGGDEKKHMWPIQKGHHVFKNSVTAQLNISSDISVHYITGHLHDMGVSLELRDITEGKTVFNVEASKFKDRLGIKNLTFFSSEKGIPIYASHDYELISVYHNTTDEIRMAAGIMGLLYIEKNPAAH